MQNAAVGVPGIAARFAPNTAKSATVSQYRFSSRHSHVILPAILEILAIIDSTSQPCCYNECTEQRSPGLCLVRCQHGNVATNATRVLIHASERLSVCCE